MMCLGMEVQLAKNHGPEAHSHNFVLHCLGQWYKTLPGLVRIHKEYMYVGFWGFPLKAGLR